MRRCRVRLAGSGRCGGYYRNGEDEAGSFARIWKLRMAGRLSRWSIMGWNGRRIRQQILEVI
jgi:hypothetical protein